MCVSVCMCLVYVKTHMCHGICLEIKEHHAGVGSTMWILGIEFGSKCYPTQLSYQPLAIWLFVFETAFLQSWNTVYRSGQFQTQRSSCLCFPSISYKGMVLPLAAYAFFFFNYIFKAGEMNHQIRALTALAEDKNLSLNTHMVVHSHP